MKNAMCEADHPVSSSISNYSPSTFPPRVTQSRVVCIKFEVPSNRRYLLNLNDSFGCIVSLSTSNEFALYSYVYRSRMFGQSLFYY